MEKRTFINRLQMAMLKKYDVGYTKICIKYAETLLEKELPVIFDSRHLYEILKMESVKHDCYHEFNIVGRKSKNRTICAPSKRLKIRQRWILDNILYKISVSDCCEGFVKNHSIYTNAKRHIGYMQNLNIDIKDFFPSITQEMIVQVFKKIGYSKDAASYLAMICCHDGRLPQGAPTSPYLANLVCRNMDMQLKEYAINHGIIFTRYADDMTFSGNCELIELYEGIERIVSKNGFDLNVSKTRICKGKKRRMITGLIVNEDSLSVPRNYKRKLKQEIYYCKRFGVANHLENTKSEKKANFREYLYGKAYYIKMIEPKTGKKFLEQLNEIQWD